MLLSVLAWIIWRRLCMFSTISSLSYPAWITKNVIYCLNKTDQFSLTGTSFYVKQGSMLNPSHIFLELCISKLIYECTNIIFWKKKPQIYTKKQTHEKKKYSKINKLNQMCLKIMLVFIDQVLIHSIVLFLLLLDVPFL